MTPLLLVGASVALLSLAPNRQEPLRYEATVGAPVEVRELVLPGSVLEPLPVSDASSVILRVAEVFAHGTAHRYDLVFYGLDPGTYDLGDFLRRADGSSTDDLPALTFEVRTLLPAGRVEPNALAPGRLASVGGYRLWMALGGVAWLTGLVLIMRTGRRKASAASAGTLRPVTLAERLRPLVERAMAGELSGEDRAELELTLIAFWRRRLGLTDLGTLAALDRLKLHDEAGPLIRRLEEWLHSPAPTGEVDVDDLLTPYRALPADMDESPAYAAR